MSTRALLVDLYGPLLTYEQLAKILDRTAASLRTNLSRRDSASGQMLASARIRVGRRVYFRTERIGELLDGQQERYTGARA
ncbi:MAG: DNA-binding protein [Stenotrophomonas sp.]|uniref:DNA-binding protein n=1 Tax=Stenotrophomonas sp. TaxID=69392 RepID=UPI003D6D2EA0